RCLRVVVFALRGYIKDDCATRAASLTYYSLLSIVPVLAMAFGIAIGFGLEKVVQARLADMAAGASLPQAVVNQMIAFSHSLLERTQGGIIAVLGFLTLFWSVLAIIQSIEQSMNRIWEVRKGRTFFRKATDYLAVMVFVPVLVVISNSAAILVAGEVATINQRSGLLGDFGPVISIALKVVPFISICAVLTLTYLIIPNTRVRKRSAILAGVIMGTAYLTVQFVYVRFQLGVSRYGAIYGGFAAIPLFIAWLRLSWMMVLFGAELAVADENQETFGFHPDLSDLSILSMKILLLRMLRLVVKRFARGEPAMTARQLSEGLEIPLRLVKRLLYQLETAGLVVQTANRDPAFQPGRTAEDLRVQLILEANERIGVSPPAATLKDGEKIAALLSAIAAAAEKAPENVPLKDV
ncbi:MAG: YhjD/YihY/BrkB family envelope integrity protein, partial [Syntrophorhabdales bacterium]